MIAVAIRTKARPDDRETVRHVTRATEMFHPPEVDVAVELVDDWLVNGQKSDYWFVFADTDSGQTLGYACFGYNSMTESSWELYWIAVDPATQGHGIGRQLLAEVETRIRAAGGTRLYAETSGRPAYAPTRAFYLASGYSVAAELAEFYAPGDGKIIFVKVF